MRTNCPNSRGGPVSGPHQRTNSPASNTSFCWISLYFAGPQNLTRIQLCTRPGFLVTPPRPAPASNGSQGSQWPSWPGAKERCCRNISNRTCVGMSIIVYLLQLETVNLDPQLLFSRSSSLWTRQDTQNQPRSPWDTAQAAVIPCVKCSIVEECSLMCKKAASNCNHNLSGSTCGHSYWITRPFQCIPTLKTSTDVVMAGHGCFGSGAKTTCAASTRADRQKPMELKDRAFPAGLAKGSVMGYL